MLLLSMFIASDDAAKRLSYLGLWVSVLGNDGDSDDADIGGRVCAGAGACHDWLPVAILSP